MGEARLETIKDITAPIEVLFYLSNDKTNHCKILVQS